MPSDAMYQIGEVAEVTGLSLRTIRHYEEVDLVPPSGRTAGGFRLYTDADIDRLQVVKQLKPLKFTLDETREIVDALDTVRDPAQGDPTAARNVLGDFAASATQRCDKLRGQLRSAQALTEMLHRVADGDQPDP